MNNKVSKRLKHNISPETCGLRKRADDCSQQNTWHVKTLLSLLISTTNQNLGFYFLNVMPTHVSVHTMNPVICFLSLTTQRALSSVKDASRRRPSFLPRGQTGIFSGYGGIGFFGPQTKDTKPSCQRSFYCTFVPPSWWNSDRVSSEVREWFQSALLFARWHSQSERNIWLLKESLDFVMELFSVLVKLHDAFWFFSHPEFIKFIRQVA